MNCSLKIPYGYANVINFYNEIQVDSKTGIYSLYLTASNGNDKLLFL